jgi:hypothetical protein
MKSLGVVFRPLTSGSAKKQASASSDLQKTHRKTKIQQKTSDKDIGQASGKVLTFMLLYSNLYFSKLTGWFNSSSSANMFSCACR